MKSKSIFIYLVLVMCFVFTLDCDALAKDSIEYVGSSTVGRFMQTAAEVYTQATFSINTKPESGGGENAVAAGKVPLGGVARDVKPGIMKKGVQAVLIGKDAIGVWANAKNPVTSLTKGQLKGIFSGTISNWKEVGGVDAGIHVYIVNPQSATRKVFQKCILGDAKYGGDVTTVRPDPAIIDKIADDPHGIGQLSFALGLSHERVFETKKLNVGQEVASVKNPNYPITRNLHLITLGAPAGHIKEFIDWTLSPKGQDILTRYFVGIGN